MKHKKSELIQVHFYFKDSNKTVDTIVNGTINMLKVARKNNAKFRWINFFYETKRIKIIHITQRYRC